MPTTLGLNAAFHDSAAALVVDGVVVAAAEEERFTRIKHAKRPLPFSAWELPFHAIDYCLAQGGLALAEIDQVAYSFDPREFLGGRLPAGEGGALPATITLPLEPSAAPRELGDDAWENPWDPLFLASVVNAPRQLVDGAPHHLRRRYAGASHAAMRERFRFVGHHLCHQASAFLAAPFKRCAVMTLDGRGEHATTSYGAYRDGAYQPLGEVGMPHSLGMLYEQATSHLGFLHSSDEYKVMALAALGTPRWAGVLGEHLRLGAHGQYTLAPVDFARLLPRRERGAALGQPHFDLAASLQQVLERTALALAGWLREASGERHLAMAGGVALNCLMNSRLRDAGLYDAVWVQPAAGDAGTALGAALWCDARARRGEAPALTPALSRTRERESLPALTPTRERESLPALTPTRERESAPSASLAPAGGEGQGEGAPANAPAGGEGQGAPAARHALGPASRDDPALAQALSPEPAAQPPLALGPRRWQMEHVYLGPAYDEAEIERALAWAKLPYRRPPDLADAAAALLADDRILGWFQGGMEWGPRALGARSILASPIDPHMQARLNELKDREDFRPVAPAVLHEELARWFAPADANAGASPFMLFVYDALPGQARRIPSACHTDASARVQTVHRETNPRFHALISAFARRTGVPVLVNTSFNVRGEPVVCTPRDAIEAFYSTPLDALAIGPFVVEKR